MINPPLSHIGVVKENGVVDTSQRISDPEKFTTTRVDDGRKIDNFKIGDFEWWYFDVFDSKENCTLKLVAHVGTDPLRRKIFPQIAISVNTPSLSKTISLCRGLNEFYAAKDICEVKIKEEFYALSKGIKYHLNIDTQDFKGEFNFHPQLAGWKPLGDKVSIVRGKKNAQFGWIIPAPRALVNGKFEIAGKQYNLEDAIGYHDHNFWRVEKGKELYLDDVISKWYWGRFFVGKHTIIFMDTYFKTEFIRSLLIAEGDTIIHSSNNLIDLNVVQKTHDDILNFAYPSDIRIISHSDNLRLNLSIQSSKIIERKDLLEGVQSFIAWLIKKIIAKPVYYGLLARLNGTIGDKDISGVGIYEFMRFRK